MTWLLTTARRNRVHPDEAWARITAAETPHATHTPARPVLVTTALEDLQALARAAKTSGVLVDHWGTP